MTDSGVVDKERIASSFSRHADTYERFAVQQRVGVEVLVDEIDCCLRELVEGPVLEVGCGTGLLSVPLVERLGQRPMLLSDLAPAMLKACRLNLGSAAGPQVKWEVLDGEAIYLEDRYALIASAFALHWFQDPVAGLVRLIGALRPGGWFFCVYQGDGSYPEWRQCCDRMGIPWTANRLPRLDHMEEALACLGRKIQWQCWRQTVCCAYASAKDFFRHLKRTGAAVRRDERAVLGTARLRCLMAAWDASGTAIEVTHQLHFIKVQRL
jgi:malonyl-CoA O-methyltransferase